MQGSPSSPADCPLSKVGILCAFAPPPQSGELCNLHLFSHLFAFKTISASRYALSPGTPISRLGNGQHHSRPSSSSGAQSALSALMVRVLLFPICTPLVAWCPPIYNEGSSGVWGTICASGFRHLFQCAAKVWYKRKEVTMSDPIAKIKQKLQKEIDQLSHELNVELPKEIAVARAHGDLSENAEYKFAKERQTYVNAKIAQLKKRMGDLGMLNFNNIPKDRSGYGSRIVVLDLTRDVKVEYKLVSSEEADAEKGLISTTSPIGRALLNRRVGDEIEVATPAGKKEFEIVELVTIHDGE